MKTTMILLIVSLLVFGCVEITPKETDTNNTTHPNEPPIIPDLIDANIIDPDLNDFVPDENQEQEPEPELPPEPLPEPLPPEPPPIIPPPPVKRGWVELSVDTNVTDVYEGEFIDVDGNNSFSGQTLKVFVDKILNTGVEFTARFRIEKDNGEIMGTNSFVAGDEVFFENEFGDPISIDALLVVKTVYAG